MGRWTSTPRCLHVFELLCGTLLAGANKMLSVRDKLREQELFETVQRKKDIWNRSKKHQHNLDQQKIMLADVQLKPEANPPVVPPLPAPREPRRLKGTRRAPLRATCKMLPLDIDTDMEDDVEWQTVQPRMRKGKVLRKLKGTPS